MWQSSCTKTYPGLTRDSVWRVWTDVNRWPDWDEELEATHFSGAFVPGARFTLKPRGGPTLHLHLESVDTLRRFTDVTRLPLARLYDVHELEETPQGLKLTSTLRLTGPLAWLWRRWVGLPVAAGVPRQMDALARRAGTCG